MRGICWVAVATLASCRCSPIVNTVPVSPLTVSVSALDFGSVWLHTVATRSVLVSNKNRFSAVLRAKVDAPYAVEPEVTLEPGSTVEVIVLFEPTGSGPAPGVLTLQNEFNRFDVSVIGEGVAWPDCGQSPECRERRFNADAGACEENDVSEGTSCASTCVADGRCSAGRCIGSSLLACDDGDACTFDSCGATGCVHSPITCAMTDPCQAARCDPLRGCVAEPVTDGAPCGRTTCEKAFICLNGQCQDRVRPDALLNCRYDDVTTAGRGTCARNLRGEVVCWGGDVFYGEHPYPRVVASLASVHGLAGTSNDVCGVTLDGGVACIRKTASFSAPVRSLFFGRSGRLCAVLTTGALECMASAFPTAADNGPRTVLASDVSEAVDRWSWIEDGGFSCEQPCALWTDGGLGCPELFSGLSVPSSSLVPLTSGGACALQRIGTASCAVNGLWRATLMASAPLVALGTSYGQVCGVSATGAFGCVGTAAIRAADGGVVDIETPQQVQRPSLRLTTGASEHLCLIDVDRRLWCRGSNSRSQLGDFSRRPRGVVEFTMRAESIWNNSFNQYVLLGDGGVSVFTTEFADAGYPLTAAVLPQLVAVGGQENPNQPTKLYAVDARGVLWSTDSTSRYQVWSPNTALPFGVTQFAGDNALVHGIAYKFDGTSFGPARAVSRDAILRLDGGVEGNPFSGLSWSPPQPGRVFTTPLQLPWVTVAISEETTGERGCAVDSLGSVRCWDSLQPDAGTEVVNAPRFPVALVGTARSGCASNGSNAVRCWGDNSYGQLGRDVPTFSATALDIALPAPVRRLSLTLDRVCALTSTQRVFCWGENRSGAFGTLPLLNSDRLIPVDL